MVKISGSPSQCSLTLKTFSLINDDFALRVYFLSWVLHIHGVLRSSTKKRLRRSLFETGTYCQVLGVELHALADKLQPFLFSFFQTLPLSRWLKRNDIWITCCWPFLSANEEEGEKKAPRFMSVCE